MVRVFVVVSHVPLLAPALARPPVLRWWRPKFKQSFRQTQRNACEHTRGPAGASELSFRGGEGGVAMLLRFKKRGEKTKAECSFRDILAKIDEVYSLETVRHRSSAGYVAD